MFYMQNALHCSLGLGLYYYGYRREFKQATGMSDMLSVRLRLNTKLKIMEHFLSPASPPVDKLSSANPLVLLWIYACLRRSIPGAFMASATAVKQCPPVFNVFHRLCSAIPPSSFYRENRGIERFIYTI